MGWFKPKQRDDAEQLRQRLQAARDRAAADRGNLRLTLDDFLEKPSEERLPAPYEERIDEAMGLAAEPDGALDGHEAVAEPGGAPAGPAPPGKGSRRAGASGHRSRGRRAGEAGALRRPAERAGRGIPSRRRRGEELELRPPKRLKGCVAAG